VSASGPYVITWKVDNMPSAVSGTPSVVDGQRHGSTSLYTEARPSIRMWLQPGWWDDVRTLLVYYQQPDADTMRRVVDLTPGGDSGSETYTQTYTGTYTRFLSGGRQPQREVAGEPAGVVMKDALPTST
jgi:hypothetical protein